MLSIDILRGIVMILMALDHTRDFFLLGGMTTDPMNPDTTNLFLFMTRGWSMILLGVLSTDRELKK